MTTAIIASKARFRLLNILVLLSLVLGAPPLFLSARAEQKCINVLHSPKATQKVLQFLPVTLDGGLKRQDELVKLKSGSKIVFSNGEEFEYIRYLGEGYFSIVLKVRNDLEEYALKIPRLEKDGSEYLSALAMESFVNAHKALDQSGIRVPQIYDYLEEEYALVQLVPVKFTLMDFLKEKVSGEYLERSAEIMDSLKNFLFSTYEFERIGDFHYGQLAYDGTQWWLLDWSEEFTFKVPKATVWSRIWPSEHSVIGYFRSRRLDFSSDTEDIFREMLNEAQREIRSRRRHELR